MQYLNEKKMRELLGDLDPSKGIHDQQFMNKYERKKTEVRKILRGSLKQNATDFLSKDKLQGISTPMGEETDDPLTENEVEALLEVNGAIGKELELLEGMFSRLDTELQPHLKHGHIVQGLVPNHVSDNYLVVKTAHNRELHQVHYHHFMRNKKTGEWEHKFVTNHIREEVVLDESWGGTAAKVGAGFVGGAYSEYKAGEYIKKIDKKKRHKAVKENYGLDDDQVGTLSDDMLDELSAGLLTRYVSAATKNIGKFEMQGAERSGEELAKRSGNIATASKKIASAQQTESVTGSIKHAFKKSASDVKKGFDYANKHPFRAALHVATKPIRDANKFGMATGKAMAVAGAGTVGYLGTKAILNQETEVEGDVIEEALNTADVHRRIDGYKKLGFRVTDVSVNDNKASFTVVDKDGVARKHIFAGTSRRVENLGSTTPASNEEGDESAPVEKKKRGRPPKNKFTIKVKK